ncbi:MAG: hypothetical protein Q8P20_05650, partial [bacterium]|nr:hypothetical protein [bacterium]
MTNLPKSLTTVTPFSKLLAGILFITFIIAAFFAGMKYQRAISLIAYQQSNLITSTPSPAPDPTANWKTYSNPTYGFSFKYPANIIDSPGGVMGGPATANIIGCFGDKRTVRQGTDAPFDGFCIYIDKSKNSLQSYVDNEKKTFLINYKFYTKAKMPATSEKNVILDGRDGIILKGYNYWGSDSLYISLFNQNILAIPFLEKSKGSFENIFNQILSTFKFTNQNPITPAGTDDRSCDAITAVQCPTGYRCQNDGNSSAGIKC